MIPHLICLPAFAICACSSRGGPAPDVAAVPATERIVTGTGGAITIGVSPTTAGVSSELPAMPDDVLTALRSVYEVMNIPVPARTGTDRLVGNGAFKVRRRIGGVPMQRYLECGGSPGQPNAETYDIVLNLMSYVVPGKDGGSVLTSRADGLGNDPKYGGGNQLRCSSTGELELRIAKLVRDRLGLP